MEATRSRRQSARPRDRDGGQATVWVILVVGIAALIGVAVVHQGNGESRRARAQSVADLTALAGATGGRDSAATVAAANQARMSSFSSDGSGVVAVVVELDGERASAHARPDGAASADGAGSGADALAVPGGATGPRGSST